MGKELKNELTLLEILCPFMLIGLGVAGIVDPILITISVLMALSPWAVRVYVFRRLSRPAYLSAPIILFAISGVVGLWATYQHTLSWPMLLTLLGGISLFYGMVNAPISPRVLAIGVVLGACFASIYFISQYSHFNYIEESGRIHRLGMRLSAWMPNFVVFVPQINAMAGFLEGAFLVSVALARQSYREGKVHWLSPPLIIGLGLLITASRGAWLGVLIGLILWVLLAMEDHRSRLILVGTSVIGAALISAVVLIRFPDWVFSTAETAISRLTIYRNSFYLLYDYPFTGIGLGDTFALVYSRYQLLIQVPYLTYSHNFYLTVGLGQGFLGLIALAWLMVSFYLFVWQIETMENMTGQPLRFFRGAWLGVTASFIHGLTDAPQFSGNGWTMPMLFALIGLTVAIGGPPLTWQAQAAADPESAFITPRMWFIFFTASSTLICLSVLYWTTLLAAWYANVGAVYQTRAELAPDFDPLTRQNFTEEAVGYFNEALRLNNKQTVAHRRLGFLALKEENFAEAVRHLETAYEQEPGNQATIKALGLAYLWAGQLDQAETLLRRVDDRGEITQELRNWEGWWLSEQENELAEYAKVILERLE